MIPGETGAPGPATMARPDRVDAAPAWVIVVAQCLVVLVTWAVIAGWLGGSEGLVRRVDHGDVLFGDFVFHYLPTARSVTTPDGAPVGGYFYPVSFAALLSPLATLDDQGARAAWWVLQIASALLITIAVPRLVTPRSPRLILFHTVLAASSVPLLHGLKWGQVSTLLVGLCFVAMAAVERRRVTIAASLLALATAIKLYPVALVLALAPLRRWWTLVVSVVLSGALLVGLPVVTLGRERAAFFQEVAQNSALGAQTSVAKDYNSQYFAGVLSRWIDHPRRMSDGYWLWTHRGGWVIAVAIGVLFAWVAWRRVDRAAMWAPVLFFATVPFTMKTSWTHYFVFLPPAQVFLLSKVSALPRSTERSWLALLLGASMMVTNASSLVVADRWYHYARAGWPLFATVAVLGVAVVLLARTPAQNGANSLGLPKRTRSKIHTACSGSPPLVRYISVGPRGKPSESIALIHTASRVNSLGLPTPAERPTR